jgi:hypothetical protein
MKDWGSGEEVQYQYDQLPRLTRAETIGPQWGLSWVGTSSVPTQSVLADMNTNRLQNWTYGADGMLRRFPAAAR